MVADLVAMCDEYLVENCEKSMIECRKAHRTKSFIESKLKTNDEPQEMKFSSFENKSSLSLEGHTDWNFKTRRCLDSVTFSTF